MKKVMFVCHGNICRSTMAEFIMKDIVKKNGKDKEYLIDSCATSLEEIGNDIYYLAKSTLDKNHIPYTHHYARQITQADYDEFDYIIIMDDENLFGLKRILKDTSKVKKILSFVNTNRDVSDPWYTRDFDSCFDDLITGCKALFTYIEGVKHDNNNW